MCKYFYLATKVFLFVIFVTHISSSKTDDLMFVIIM